MIRRPRNLVGVPSVLGDVGTLAATERVAATLHFQAIPVIGKFTFSVYSHAEVKGRLNQLFGHKCAYCEGVLKGMLPMDVEHYRPKGRISTRSGTILSPGYWWLASAWSNLLPSCIDCNRERWHDEDNGVDHKHGKADKFPLAVGSHQAVAEGEEVLENTLLLNPAADDPQPHLTFKVIENDRMKESVAVALTDHHGSADEKGIFSIDTYGLNRPGLVAVRMARIEELRLALDGISRNWRLARTTTDPVTAAELREACREDMRKVVRLYLHWKCPYSSACREYFESWKTATAGGAAMPVVNVA
ncbi:hypothetical protein BLJAPNOD_00845 [Ensifer sp. M14]|uniref:hypothetical protein n=1 Tax=Ensifer sp. M14 TaxID=2203782 RepID=UPI000E2D5D92|nr:hypothetical protein [Ensifer sp. M14]RDL49737.1 hypothetical protein BLJAPNOD_00845 [Ensifer sp. M14]